MFIKEVERERTTVQTNLFATKGQSGLPKLQLLEIEPATKEQRLSWEKEFLGLYVTEHPFTEFEPYFSDIIVPLHKIVELRNKNGEKQILTAGVITNVHKIITAKGDPMLFVRIENSLFGLEVLIFPKLYQEIGSMLVEEKIIVVNGNLSDKDDDDKILANMVWEVTKDNLQGLLNQIKGFQPRRLEKKNILIDYPKGGSHELAERVKVVFRRFPGTNGLYFKVGDKTIKTNFQVKYCPGFDQAICDLLGKNSVKIKQ